MILKYQTISESRGSLRLYMPILWCELLIAKLYLACYFYVWCYQMNLRDQEKNQESFLEKKLMRNQKGFAFSFTVSLLVLYKFFNSIILNHVSLYDFGELLLWCPVVQTSTPICRHWGDWYNRWSKRCLSKKIS